MPKLLHLLPLLIPFAVAADEPLRTVEPKRLTSFEARSAPPDMLVLKAGAFDPVTERLSTKGFETEFEDYGIVQFEEGVKFTQSTLEDLGVDVIDLIPNRAFVVRWDAESRARISKHAGVRYSGAFRSVYKVSAGLLTRSPQPGRISLQLMGFPGTDEERLALTVSKLLPSVRVEKTERVATRPWVRVSLDRSVLAGVLRTIADIPSVYFIERHIQPQIENADSVGVVQNNSDSGGLPPTATPIWDQGIIGTGQIVAVFDSGVDRNSDFFYRLDQGNGLIEEYTDASDVLPPTPGPVFPNRKIYGYFVQPDASPYDDAGGCQGSIVLFHGTHVAGSVAGDAGTPSTPEEANYDDGDGMAPNAQLLVMDIGNDDSGCLSGINSAMYEQAFNAGAFIHSSSFGGGVVDPDTGEIDPDSQIYAGFDFFVDTETYRFEDLLFVKSAGNDGNAGLTTLSHPGYAKNGVAVAASEHGNNPSPASFSSRGPTFDGRIKPDITAPGVDIVSAAGNDLDDVPPPPFNRAGTRPDSGTSFAAPTLSGSAALARQYFTDGFYPSGVRNPDDELIPTGALLKGVLLNGTRLYADTPSVSTGWGRVWLDNNLYFAGDDRDLRVWDLANLNGLQTGDRMEFDVEVPAGEPFRATLTWYDPPGPVLSAGRVLVNDLDLEVVTPSETFRGNRFSGGQSVAGGNADTIDNTEQVILPQPEGGRYTVRVKATDVPGNGDQNTDLQGFALVVSKAQCSSGVSDAPDLNLTQNPDSLAIDFTGVTGAETYQVYRAVGGCGVSSEQFEFVGQSDSLAFEDLKTQGGFEYGYRVRGVDACGEGPASTCKSAVSTAACKLVPKFDQTTVDVTLVGDGTCSVDLSWDEGQSSCPGTGLTYSIYRSTDPNFRIGSDTLVASGVRGDSFIDIDVESLKTYYYTVRAEDTTDDGAGPNQGNESTGQIRYQITTFGNENEPGTFVDDPDDITLVRFGEPWQLTTQEASTGRFSYHNAADGENYPPNTCARIVTPTLELQEGSPVLSYDARFELEVDWDGVIVEISNDDGETWLPLPPDQGYPGTLNMTQPNGGEPVNACGYLATTEAFTGDQETFRNYTSDLSDFAGQDVILRWSFTSDPGLEFDGFYLDNIQVTNASNPSACTVAEANTAVSGPWFNVDQAGHGWLIERLAGVSEGDPDRINAYWYVYRDGNPVWLIGGGDLVNGSATLDTFITENGDFPPNFESADVIPWGSLTFDFDSEDMGTASWVPVVEGFEAGELPIQRLAPLSDSPQACRSGSYYNADQAGHGFVAEVFDLGGVDNVLLAWYVYLNGEQVWLLGQAPIADGKADVPMGRFSGADFPPDFDPDAVINDAWGTVSIEFTGPDSATVTWDSDQEADFPDGSLDVIRLTEIKGKTCN